LRLQQASRTLSARARDERAVGIFDESVSHLYELGASVNSLENTMHANVSNCGCGRMHKPTHFESPLSSSLRRLRSSWPSSTNMYNKMSMPDYTNDVTHTQPSTISTNAHVNAHDDALRSL
jgi:hypothetical protein